MINPVQDLLTSKGVSYIPSGKDFLTKCFNPEHTDKNPSFRIDQISGVANCFSCGFKTNIFKYYGVLTNHTSIRVAKLQEKLRALKVSLDGQDMLEGARPFTTPFRGISVKTLKHFGAFKTDEVDKLEDRIIFPITDVRGKISVFVARHLNSNADSARYLMYPAGTTIPLYPSSFPAPTTSIILVEGIFDMLNLYDKGLRNVVCTFGTGGLAKDTADKLLTYKVRGVTKVYIMYDGDKAGRDAAAKIKPLIEAAEFTVEIIEMEEGTDPGESSQEDVDSLIEYTK